MTAARASIRVRVIPRATRARLVVDDRGVLRVYVTAPPVDGAANRALIALLAERLEVAKRDVVIARGAHGRDKVVTVVGLSEADVARLLAR